MMVTQNEAMKKLMDTAERVAKTQATVLITGESGSGKEVLAQFIHFKSKRHNKPYIVVNCGAIPKDIVESELFGHEKGAFTGALHQKPGYFEMADQGTLFFDELVELPADTQVKLLRTLESSNFRRVGGEKELSVDVRFIAATNKDIQSQIKKGLFREDLFYRLGVIEMEIPPLRSRKDDIPLLIEHFMKIYIDKYEMPLTEISERSLKMMTFYSWPGNVRELRNVIERLVILYAGKVVEPEDLPIQFHELEEYDDSSFVGSGNDIRIPVGSSMDQAERIIINKTLSSVGNNISQAARILSVSRKTLHNKLNQFKENGITK